MVRDVSTARDTVFVAGEDGVGHASAEGLSRTLCGLPAIDERDGWPMTDTCFRCLTLAAPGPAPAGDRISVRRATEAAS